MKYQNSIADSLANMFNLRPIVTNWSDEETNYRRVDLLPIGRGEFVFKKVYQKLSPVKERLPSRISTYIDKALENVGLTNEPKAKIVLIDATKKDHSSKIPFRRVLINDEKILPQASRLLETVGFSSPLLTPPGYFQMRDDF